MSYPSEFIIKFYDGFSLVKEIEIEANDGKEALKIALKQVEGLANFNKVKIINLGICYCH